MLPILQEIGLSGDHFGEQTLHVAAFDADIEYKLRCAGWPHQIYFRLPCARYVHMRWLMVLRVDHEPKAEGTIDDDHRETLTYQLGLCKAKDTLVTPPARSRKQPEALGDGGPAVATYAWALPVKIFPQRATNILDAFFVKSFDARVGNHIAWCLLRFISDKHLPILMKNIPCLLIYRIMITEIGKINEYFFWTAQFVRFALP